MFGKLTDLAREWRQWRAFSRLPEPRRRLVVYSEGAHDWPHIGPMLESLLARYPDEAVTYVSSGKDDPGLSYQNERFLSFCIGTGLVRTLFFQSLRCRLLLLTLPDIETFHLKRSKVHPVHYVYCFHSINSTHTVYRPRAFAHYDTILCVGPHHVRELRREEELGLAGHRQLLEHGSVKLDTVMRLYADSRQRRMTGSTPMILLAPSWGIGSFFEDPALLRTMIGRILEEGWECRLRLHPMTRRHRAEEIDRLKEEFSARIEGGTFLIEEDLNDNRSLRDAAVMVSDWSGAATEFAFGLERPVLFINTPQKVNNPEWPAFGMKGLEDSIRGEIGLILEPSAVDDIVPAITRLITDDTYAERIRSARDALIFNVNRSAEVGADHLARLLAESEASAPAALG